MSRSLDIICGGGGKKLRRFHTICHVRCLQTEVSQMENRRVEKDSVRFEVKVTVELGFDFKTFCKATENKDYFMCKFGNFLDPFDNFNLLSAIIEF